MINLLPPDQKEELLMEKNKRIIMILWFLFIFFILSLSWMMFFIKVYIQSQIDVYSSSLAENERLFLESESKKFREDIKSINSILSKLDVFYSRKVYFSELMQKVSSTLPKTCYLINFSMVYSVEEKKKEGTEEKIKEKYIKVSLSGFSPSREDLLEFKNSLEQQENFQDIYFPASNWVEPKDINFNVTFNIPF